MPVPDQADEAAPSSRDNPEDKDQGGKAKGSSKSKDLSHVPCKFFKVGSCTAGSSCPFSHHLGEPGQQKDVCTWFVKGNCKFGHKCALAHVLPGQSMSMDRKNKKAAQLSAGGGSSGHRDREGASKNERSRTQKPTGNLTTSLRAGSGQTRNNSLLTGSTAPTRVLASGSRPPLPITKAVPAPATPAPLLQDTDFPLDMDKQDGSSLAVTSTADHVLDPSVDDMQRLDSAAEQQIFLPISTPTRPMRLTARHGSSPSVDFGPVGSPPRSSPSDNPTRINGFSPSASPAELSRQTVVHNVKASIGSPEGRNLLSTLNAGEFSGSLKSGLAASMGADRTMTVASLPTISHTPSPARRRPVWEGTAVEDEDMEEFIPSSLTDLLTPGERNRRMSRTTSNNAGAIGGISLPRPTVQDHHHRYSRSVPATSLLSDIKSIWTDPATGHSSHKHPGAAGVRGEGPESFVSSLGTADDGVGQGYLSASNTSAAFLPILHQQYLSRPVVGAHVNQSSQRSVSGHLATTNGSFSSSAYLRGRPDAFEDSPAADSMGMPQSFHPQYLTGRPIPPSNAANTASDHLLSPSARALQAHAPGQSLPQGLAAGYSRIHVQPPPANLPSPATSGTYSSSFTNRSQGRMAVGSPDWISGSPSKSKHMGSEQTSLHSIDQSHESGVGGLTSMFSHLSYSAAASRNPTSAGGLAYSGISQGSPPGVPMSMNRKSSGRGWPLQPLSSPLSGPVLTSDDDDLFAMDEEE